LSTESPHLQIISSPGTLANSKIENAIGIVKANIISEQMQVLLKAFFKPPTPSISVSEWEAPVLTWNIDKGEPRTILAFSDFCLG
jgi:hypothetical protein